MTFYVENNTEETFEFDINKLIKELTSSVLLSLHCPFSDISLNVTFTDDEEIRDINREYRGIDKATDVLSFPAIDFNTPGDFSHIESDDPSFFDVESGELILGDIMISLDHARAQAIEYGHSYKREIAFLLTHSLFHLSGFDHETEDERIDMEKRQEDVLVALGITREAQ